MLKVFLPLDKAIESLLIGETPYVKKRIGLARDLLKASGGEDVPITKLAVDVVRRIVNESCEGIEESEQ